MVTVHLDTQNKWTSKQIWTNQENVLCLRHSIDSSIAVGVLLYCNVPCQVGIIHLSLVLWGTLPIIMPLPWSESSSWEQRGGFSFSLFEYTPLKELTSPVQNNLNSENRAPCSNTVVNKVWEAFQWLFDSVFTDNNTECTSKPRHLANPQQAPMQQQKGNKKNQQKKEVPPPLKKEHGTVAAAEILMHLLNINIDYWTLTAIQSILGGERERDRENKLYKVSF